MAPPSPVRETMIEAGVLREETSAAARVRLSVDVRVDALADREAARQIVAVDRARATVLAADPRIREELRTEIARELERRGRRPT